MEMRSSGGEHAIEFRQSVLHVPVLSKVRCRCVAHGFLNPPVDRFALAESSIMVLAELAIAPNFWIVGWGFTMERFHETGS
jgi:hypothetical protein